MIKFFRHIRQRLLNENKFSKYLIYAVGEIVLVVIGILIALQINTWNDIDKRSELKQVYYHQLLKDLITDKEYLNEKLNFYNDRIADYETYLNSYEKPNLSPIEVLQNQNKLNFATDNIRFQGGTIETLENTGDIKLIPIDVKNRLMELKRSQELVVEFANLNYSYYLNSINPAGLSGSIPGFEKRLQNQPDLRDYLKIEENSDVIILSIEFASYLKIYNEKSNIKQFNTMLINIDTIVELINADLKN
jgi:hypothetical protein